LARLAGFAMNAGPALPASLTVQAAARLAGGMRTRQALASAGRPRRRRKLDDAKT
jgi:protein involved in polysaccharide export with SLBB domain